MYYKDVIGKTKSEAELSALYGDFGLDRAGLLEGKVPSWDQFHKAVFDKLKATMAEEEAAFKVVDFKDKVVSLFRDIRQKSLRKKLPAKNLEGELRVQTQYIGGLEEVLKNRQDLLKRMTSDPLSVLEEIKGIAGELKLPVMFRNRYKTQETSDPGESHRYEINVRLDKIRGIENSLDILEKVPKGITREQFFSNSKFSSALGALRASLQKGIEQTQLKLKAAQVKAQEISEKLNKLGEKVQWKTLIEKPVTISPFVDADGLLDLLEAKAPREREVREVHPFAWLRDPSHITSVIKGIDKTYNESFKKGIGEGLDDHTKKTDLMRVNETRKELIGVLWNLNKKGIDVIPGIRDIIKTDLHTLSSLKEHQFEAYKNFVDTLKKKYSLEDFKKLTNWNSSLSSFKVVDKDLAPEMEPDRDKLNKIHEIVNRQKTKNETIIKDHWEKVLKELSELKMLASKVNVLYRKIEGEAGHKDWLKGKTPVEFREKKADLIYAVYQDPGKDLAGIMQAVNSFAEYLKGHDFHSKAFTTKKYTPDDGPNKGQEKEISVPRQDITPDEKDSVAREILQGTYLKDFTNKLNSLVKKIKDYIEDTENFLDGLMTGTSLEGKPVKADLLRRFAAADFMKRLGLYCLWADARWPTERSEYPVTVPLVDIRKNPKVFHDYFQKSFPIEKIHERWKQLSGGNTLDAAVFPKLIKEMDSYLEGEIKRKYQDEQVREQLAKLKEQKDAIMKDRVHQDAILQKAEDWANKASQFFDANIKEEEEKSDIARGQWQAIDQDIHIIRNRLLTNLKMRKQYGDVPDRVIKENSTKLDDLIAELRDKLTEMDVRDKFIVKLEDYINGIQHSWSGVGVRALSKIQDSQDKEFELDRKIHYYEQLMKEGMPKEDMEYLKKWFVKYLWNVLDEDWSRKIKEYQTALNLNFEDYKAIHKAVKDIVGDNIHGRLLGRAEEGLKEQMQMEKEKHVPVSEGTKELLKNIKKRQRQAIEEPEVPEIMVYDIASKFADFEIPEIPELELLSR